MVMFVGISSLYFAAILFMLIKRGGNINEEFVDITFISHEHTNAIKGIAAVGIMISHIAAQIKINVIGPARYYVLLCTTLGGIGVNLFFFASGFGNYYSVKKLASSSARTKWLLKRVVNIISIFLVCFILTSIVLYGGGYRQTLIESTDRIIGLRMPLTKTWYLKVQILLYVVLAFSLFFTKKAVQGLLLIGLSMVSSFVFYRLGYAEEWWKSTMCFVVGYYCAMYKAEIFRFIKSKRNLAGWISLVTLPVFFVMACLIDNYVIKVLGNTLLMICMMIIAEYFKFDSHVAGNLGTVSLELYLIHISLNSWFLRDRIPDTVGIVHVIVWTAVATFLAKLIDNRISTRIRKIN